MDALRRWLPRLLALGAVVLVSAMAYRHVAAVLGILLARFDYPFDLEWMEGGMLHHALRVYSGQSLYAEPTPEFMPFIYTPGYHYVSAAAMTVLGVGLSALRAVSLLGLAASCVLLALVARRASGRLDLALLAIPLLLATFLLSGAWFDVARVDMLALALSLAPLALLSENASRTRLAAAGLCVGLAFLTKQSTLAAVPALGLFVLACHGLRGGVWFTVPALLSAGGVTLLEQLRSDGWYWYYTVELPSTHGIKNREYLITGFFRDEMFRALPVLSTLSALALSMSLLRPPGSMSRYAKMVAGAALLMLLGSYTSRLHMGSYANDLIPAHVALILLSCMAISGLQETMDGPSSSQVATGGLLLFALQLWLLPVPDAGQLVPSAADRAAGQQVVEHVRAVDGPVLVVNHPTFAILAGKRPYTHQMAMIDVFESESDPRGVRELLRRKWEPLLANQRFREVIMDNDWYVFSHALRAHYRRANNLRLKDRALLPKTGTLLRPEWVWLPQPRR